MIGKCPIGICASACCCGSIAWWSSGCFHSMLEWLDAFSPYVLSRGCGKEVILVLLKWDSSHRDSAWQFVEMASLFPIAVCQKSQSQVQLDTWWIVGNQERAPQRNTRKRQDALHILECSVFPHIYYVYSQLRKCRNINDKWARCAEMTCNYPPQMCPCSQNCFQI